LPGTGEEPTTRPASTVPTTSATVSPSTSSGEGRSNAIGARRRSTTPATTIAATRRRALSPVIGTPAPEALTSATLLAA